MRSPSHASWTKTSIDDDFRAFRSFVYSVAAESAIQSVIHGDLNASAFQVPGTEAVNDDVESATTPAPAAEGVLVTEEPMRADLFIVLGGMWVGTFLSALE